MTASSRAAPRGPLRRFVRGRLRHGGRRGQIHDERRHVTTTSLLGGQRRPGEHQFPHLDAQRRQRCHYARITVTFHHGHIVQPTEGTVTAWFDLGPGTEALPVPCKFGARKHTTTPGGTPTTWTTSTSSTSGRSPSGQPCVPLRTYIVQENMRASHDRRIVRSGVTASRSTKLRYGRRDGQERRELSGRRRAHSFGEGRPCRTFASRSSTSALRQETRRSSSSSAIPHFTGSPRQSDRVHPEDRQHRSASRQYCPRFSSFISRIRAGWRHFACSSVSRWTPPAPRP